MGIQLDALERGVEIIVATPGRLIDHLKRGSIELMDIEHIVLPFEDQSEPAKLTSTPRITLPWHGLHTRGARLRKLSRPVDRAPQIRFGLLRAPTLRER